MLALLDVAEPASTATLFSAAGLAALAALVTLEIVLGIDNVVFLSILVERLPEEQQARARFLGLFFAMVMRLALLAVVGLILRLTGTAFEVFGHPFTWKDLVLLAGGLFLIYKAVKEIHKKLETDEEGELHAGARATFAGVLIQVLIMDAVFSLDSIITAVGMTQNQLIIAIAIVSSVVVMMIFARPIGRFIHHHPTTKMLALSFMLLIGVTLMIEGAGGHVGKGYIYAAMAFAILVEALNLLAGKASRKRAAAAGKIATVLPDPTSLRSGESGQAG
ncbi:MAG: TerC family protein [Planctomycetota bacterium]